MKIPAITIMPDPVVRALYLTLIHSLWQGVILAVLTALIIAATRKASPAKRYNLLAGTLVLFTLTGVFTFFYMLSQAGHSAASVKIGLNTKEANDLLWNTVLADLSLRKPMSEAIVSFFDRNAGNIVLVWLLVISFRSLKLVLGLGAIYRLRYSGIYPVQSTWQHKVKELAEQTGVRRAVDMAVSGIARVPMVIGHLKPLILLPVGLMAMLPPAEVEAILIHELAHIRRRDYLVNLLQSLVEIFYFFNPAVWWLSSLIRTEREHCCDEIVVLQTNSKRNYIQALVSCQEYQLGAGYAMAINGHKNHLTTRVKRILSNSNPVLSRYERLTLTLCLATVIMLSATVFQYFQYNRSIAHPQRRTAQATIFPPVSTLSEGVSPSAPHIATEAEPVPPAGQPAAPASPAMEARPAAQPESIAPVARPEPASPVAPPEPAAARRQHAIQVQIDRLSSAAQPIVIDLRREVPVTGQKQEAQQAVSEKAEEQKRKAEKDKANAEQSHLSPDGSPGVTPQVSADKLSPRALPTDKLIAELEKEGIIAANAKELSFTLSNESFIVNGTRQPVKIFLKYRDQYVVLTGDRGQWEVTYQRKFKQNRI